MTSAPAADKKTAQQLYFALPILRGLLADRSGNEDDPYSRVIIARTDGCKRSSAGDIPALNVGPLLAEAVWYDPKRRRAASGGPTNFGDALRKTFRASIDKFTAQHGAAPVRVKLADAGLFQIEHGDPGGTKLKIAIVTGAAGAIGAGICRSLLAHGFYVAATDLIQESLDGLIKELKSLAPDRIMGVRMDVTDKESVTAGFSEVICQWGGVDIIVVNAGIAMVAPLMDLDPDAFRKLEKVNVEGTLLTLAEAGRCLCRQNTGGDIVLVSTKNVFSPGAQFGAYSATKAAN